MKKLKLFLASMSVSLLPSLVQARIGAIITEPSGTSGEVQFENDGLFDGTTAFTYNKTTNRLTVSSAAVTYIQGSTAAFNQIKWADGTTQTTAGGAGGGDAYLGNTQTFTAPQTWVSSATFQDQAFSVGGSTLMTTSGNVSVGNNLGIGLSNPTVRLQINTPGLDLGFNNTGFLGIGTTNAGQALEISGGNAYIGGFITATGTGTVSGNAFSVGGSSFAVSGGKVGAGTSSPAYTLQVASAAGSSGTIFAVTTGAVAMIQLQGDGDVLANRFIGDGSQLTGLAGGGDAVLSATQTFSGNDTFNIPRGSTMTFNGNMKSTGVFEAAYLQGDGSRLTGIASGGGDAYLGSTQTFTAPQTFRSSVTVTNQGFSVGTSTFAVKNGLVGVGTSSPSYGFHVATGAYFEQGAEFGGALGAWTSPGTQFQIGVNGSVPLTLYSASMTVVGSTFVVRETGNIGIGTTNPSQRLVIAGGAGANVAVIQSSGGSVGLNITASDALGGYTAIGPTTNNPFFLQSNNLTRMTVGADGRVGVSTTSPVAALAVGGGITTSSTITAQGGFYGDGANLTNLTAANVSAGSLGGSVIASSITLAAMYGAPTLTGTNFSGVANTALDSSSVTKQGNTFNAANKLVLLNGSGELPALSAANLTSIPWGNLSGVPAGFADGVDNTSAGGGDNMGDHSSTMNITMNNYALTGAGAIGIGTTAPAFPLVIVDTFTAGSGVTRGLDFKNTGLNLSANQVYFGGYFNAVHTGTTDNTGNAAHYGGLVVRSSNVYNSMTDAVTFEPRADERAINEGTESTALLAYMDMVATGPANGLYSAIRARGCVSTNGDCGTDSSTGAIRALYIENVQGGAAGENHAIYQEGADDLNTFLGNVGIGPFSSTPNDKLLITASSTGAIKMVSTLPTIQSTYGHDGPSSSTVLGTDTSHRVRIKTAGTDRLVAREDGRIGIGTSSPTHLLDVEGGIFASSTVTASAFYGDGAGLTGLDDDQVLFDDADSNFTATTVGAAIEELDNVNGSGPNASDGKVDWSQLVSVPAGFADGTDDGGGGGVSTTSTNTWTAGQVYNSYSVFSGSVTFSSTTVSSNVSTTSYTNQWVDFSAGSTVTIRGGLRDQNNSYGTMNFSVLTSSGSGGVAWMTAPLFGTIYSSTAASTSTSTYANAPTALGFPVVSGSTYTFSYDLSVGCSGTGGMRVGLIGPSITSVRTKAWGNGSATALIVFSTGSLTTSGGIGSMSTPFNTTNSTTGRVFLAGQIVPSADGFVQLVFCPVTSGQTATIYEGTRMEVWRRQ